MKRLSISLLAFLLAGFSPLAWSQDQITTFQDGDANGYASTQDTGLRFSAPTNAIGADVSISVDGANAGGVEQGLIQFDDVFGAGPNQVPLGETIFEAYITFWSFDPGADVAIHRMLTSWDENTVTYSNFVDGIQADDAEAAVTPTSIFATPVNTFVQADVTADLRAWQAGATNFGWALLPTDTNGWDFDSSESTNLVNRPMLTVRYGTPIPPIDLSTGTLPRDATVTNGRQHVLSASFDGLPTPDLQWYLNGAAITGAVSDTYVITNMTAQDAGAYFVRATNNVGSADSRTATITFIEDLVAPRLVTNGPAAPFILDDQTLTLAFNEALETNTFNAAQVEIYPTGGDPVADNLGVAGFTSTSSTNFVLTTTLPPLEGVAYLLNLHPGTVADVHANSNTVDFIDIPISNGIQGPSLVRGSVRANGSVQLVFDETMSTGTPAQISIYPTGGDPDTENLGVQTIALDANPTNLVLTTTSATVLGASYSVRIVESGVADANDNPNTLIFDILLQQEVPLVRDGARWSYLDDGSDQGSAWVATNFNDSAWASGFAQFGYGDGDENTVVSFGPAANAKYTTTYYRRNFVIPRAADFVGLVVGLMRDDGAVVYLNGSELLRDNLPDAPTPILFDTFANAAATAGDETTFFEFAVDAGLLVDGTNTLAVEIHQSSLTSSDTSFDLYLGGTATNLSTSVPTIELHPQSVTTNEYDSIRLSVAAAGLPAPLLQWEFDDGINGYVALPGETRSELVFDPVVPSQSGMYRAVASNYLGVAFSDPAAVTIIPDTIAPMLLSARGDAFNVYLEFSELLAPSVGATTSYALVRASGGGALTITNAIVNGTQVTLQHLESQPNGEYQVVISDLTDLAESPNPLDPSPTVRSYNSDLVVIASNGVWRALDDGSDQGTAWRETGFDDSSWTNGPAELGYGDGDEATVLGFGGVATQKFATTYFRHTFVLAADAGFTSNLVALLHYDDGAVTYVNGTEVNRVNITNDLATPVRFDDYAGPVATDDRVERIEINPALLVAGTNTIAVEIHQTSPTSSDISFSLELSGQTGRYEAPSNIVLALPRIAGGELIIEFSDTGGLYLQETDALAVDPANTIWTTITSPPGPHTSPLNLGPVTENRRYYRITDTP